jgi:DGQHR domain-containing protein
MSEELQREQFILVNKTKPLPRDLLNELLAHMDTEVPSVWRLRRIASAIVERLRFDRTSPFYGRIRGIGSLGEGCNISQAAVIAVIETSIRRGGVLASYCSTEDRVADVPAMADVLSAYFQGVKAVWPTAWEASPRTSRLVHGVGITALGRLMDVIVTEVGTDGPRALLKVTRRLRKLEQRCSWMAGRWPAPLDCPWYDLQNTSQDKRRLADYLLHEYRTAR